MNEIATSTPVDPAVMPALAALLPALRGAPGAHGRFESKRRDDGIVVDYGWVGAPHMDQLLELLFAGKVTIVFDWMSWLETPEGQRLEAEPGAAASADLSDVRRALTALVRRDRFAAGSLADAIERGIVPALVARLVELVGGRDATAAAATASRPNAVAIADLDAAIRDLQRQRRGGRWRLYGIIALVAIAPVVFLVAYPRYKQRQYERSLLLDDAGTRELRDLIGQLDPKAAECRAVWEKQTTAEALAALQIDPEARCPVHLPMANEKEENEYVEFGDWSGAALFFGGWPLQLVGADGKVDGGGGCTSDLLLKSLGERLDRGEAKATDLSDARQELNRREGYEVVFLVTKQVRGKFDWAQPKFVGIDSFMPGMIRGRALVYSQASRRFVCGGEVEARNSPTVKVHFTRPKDQPLGGRENKADATDEVLKRDLGVQLRRQIASGLSALGGQ